MANKTWKNVERRIADLLGGERIGPAGTPQPDVVTPWLVVEVKHRKRLPQWIKDAVDQARAQVDVSRLPVAVLHEKYAPYDKSLVVVRLDDWLAWFGDDGEEESA